MGSFHLGLLHQQQPTLSQHLLVFWHFSAVFVNLCHDDGAQQEICCSPDQSPQTTEAHANSWPSGWCAVVPAWTCTATTSGGSVHRSHKIGNGLTKGVTRPTPRTMPWFSPMMKLWQEET